MTDSRPLLANRELAGKIYNGLAFNVGWLAIVTGESTSWALLVVAVYLSLHFLLLSRASGEWMMIGAIALFGAGLDQILFAAGLFQVNQQWSLAPLWLTCLWPLLASTLSHAFSGLQERLMLAAVLGTIGGGLSYIAGVRLTDVNFSDPLWGPALIAALWAIIFPCLAFVARQVRQHQESGNGHAQAV